MTLDTSFRHRLTLTGNYTWNFYTETPVLEWAERLAYILELRTESGNDLPGLFFVKPFSADQTVVQASEKIKEIAGGDLPVTGWRMQDYKSIRVWINDVTPDIIYEIDPASSIEMQTIMMWLSLVPIYEKIISLGGLPLHAALIELNGRGIILAGPGGRGKSTCCSRLPAPWRPLCDDEVLIIPDADGKYHAHPFPTASVLLYGDHDSSWQVEQSLPVEAVFLLNRSESDSADPIGAGLAAMELTQSALQVCQRGWRKLDLKTASHYRQILFNSACDFAAEIKTCKLNVSLNGSFWEVIEKTLQG